MTGREQKETTSNVKHIFHFDKSLLTRRWCMKANKMYHFKGREEEKKRLCPTNNYSKSWIIVWRHLPPSKDIKLDSIDIIHFAKTIFYVFVWYRSNVCVQTFACCKSSKNLYFSKWWCMKNNVFPELLRQIIIVAAASQPMQTSGQKQYHLGCS